LIESAKPAVFPTTNWSRVAHAGDPDEAVARAALAELCSAYWYPIYALIRRLGHPEADARDLTQAYFARLIEEGTISVADPARGRFRTFLRVDCTYFLGHERERERALKRGGAARIHSISVDDAERRFRLEPAHDETAERRFERDWAVLLIGRAMGRVERHYQASHRGELFRNLKPILTGEPDAARLTQLAVELETTAAALRNALLRIRARLADALRAEISETLRDPTPEAVADELRDLFAALER